MAYRTKIISVSDVKDEKFSVKVEFKDDQNVLETFEKEYPVDLEMYPTKDSFLDMIKTHRKNLNKQIRTINNLKEDLESEVGK